MRSPTPTFLRTSTSLSSALAVSLGGVLLTSLGTARADPPPFAARAEGTRVAFSLDLWPTQDAVVATMGLSAQIAVHPHFAIDVDVPWAAGNLNEGQPGFSVDRAVYGYFGDVTLGGHAVFRVLPAAALAFGATVSIPTRYDFQGAADLSIVSVHRPDLLRWRCRSVSFSRAAATVRPAPGARPRMRWSRSRAHCALASAAWSPP